LFNVKNVKLLNQLIDQSVALHINTLDRHIRIERKM